jgi:cytochrome c oxidase subunit IV
MSQDTTLSSEEISKKKIHTIWKVAGILGLVTAIEFGIAFSSINDTLKIFLFVGLTIVKAFYIVGEFMHLKHEVKFLIWSIMLPLIFVCWLIVALIVEGGSLY